MAAKWLVALLILLVTCTAFAAQGLSTSPVQDRKMIARATPYMPTLKAKVDKYWPDNKYPVTLAALIEQESLWNPHAELCVPKGTCAREYGFGFGQLTITPRFNIFEEVKSLNPDLQAWKYEDRFNPDYQIAAVVIKNRLHYRQCEKIMHPGVEAQGCGFSSYNGGYGGVVADRRLCANTQGCDPFKWFGNVERVSLKAKVAQPGYGKSFFEINREYPHLLMEIRPPKYTTFPGFASLPFP